MEYVECSGEVGLVERARKFEPVNWWTGRDSDPRPSGFSVKNLQTGRSSALG